jgi:hypothetical protein
MEILDNRTDPLSSVSSASPQQSSMKTNRSHQVVVPQALSLQGEYIAVVGELQRMSLDVFAKFVQLQGGVWVDNLVESCSRVTLIVLGGKSKVISSVQKSLLPPILKHVPTLLEDIFWVHAVQFKPAASSSVTSSATTLSASFKNAASNQLNEHDLPVRTAMTNRAESITIQRYQSKTNKSSYGADIKGSVTLDKHKRSLTMCDNDDRYNELGGYEVHGNSNYSMQPQYMNEAILDVDSESDSDSDIEEIKSVPPMEQQEHTIIDKIEKSQNFGPDIASLVEDMESFLSQSQQRLSGIAASTTSAIQEEQQQAYHQDIQELQSLYQTCMLETFKIRRKHSHHSCSLSSSILVVDANGDGVEEILQATSIPLCPQQLFSPATVLPKSERKRSFTSDELVASENKPKISRKSFPKCFNL